MNTQFDDVQEQKGKQMLHLYKNPYMTGWLGWFENTSGKALAFVTLSGQVVPMPKV